MATSMTVALRMDPRPISVVSRRLGVPELGDDVVLLHPVCGLGWLLHEVVSEVADAAPGLLDDLFHTDIALLAETHLCALPTATFEAVLRSGPHVTGADLDRFRDHRVLEWTVGRAFPRVAELAQDVAKALGNAGVISLGD